MKERPILFKGEMVKAILDGTKTQTRRVVKESVLARYNQIDAAHQGWDDFAAAWNAYARVPDDELTADAQVLKAKLLALCPYGKPDDTGFTRWGDREPPCAGTYEVIWEPGDTPVRVELNPEFGWTWAELPNGDPEAIEIDIAEPAEIRWREPGDHLWVRETWAETVYVDGDRAGEHEIVYRADAPDFQWVDGDGGVDYREDGCPRSSWRPSIHMPRKVSRITLEVTGVRVERVQEISTSDIDAEGLPIGRGLGGSQEMEFRELWDSINAKRGYGWDKNCWVWVVVFKRIRP
jgi:hypothetical protein